MSFAFSSSSEALTGTARPPFPPLVTIVFFSAILLPTSSLTCAENCVVRDLSTFGHALVNAASTEAKYWQIEGYQDSAHKNCHHNQDQWLDQSHGGSQSRLHIFFVKFCNRRQHRRQRSGRLAHFNHFDGKIGEDFLVFQAPGKATALANATGCICYAVYDPATGHRGSRCFHCGYKRQAPQQQSR